MSAAPKVLRSAAPQDGRRKPARAPQRVAPRATSSAGPPHHQSAPRHGPPACVAMRPSLQERGSEVTTTSRGGGSPQDDPPPPPEPRPRHDARTDHRQPHCDCATRRGPSPHRLFRRILRALLRRSRPLCRPARRRAPLLRRRLGSHGGDRTRPRAGRRAQTVPCPAGGWRTPVGSPRLRRDLGDAAGLASRCARRPAPRHHAGAEIGYRLFPAGAAAALAPCRALGAKPTAAHSVGAHTDAAPLPVAVCTNRMPSFRQDGSRAAAPGKWEGGRDAGRHDTDGRQGLCERRRRARGGRGALARQGPRRRVGVPDRRPARPVRASSISRAGSRLRAIRGSPPSTAARADDGRRRCPSPTRPHPGLPAAPDQGEGRQGEARRVGCWRAATTSSSST